jgi:multicomponent Na+:H+ antiporter subunit G
MTYVAGGLIVVGAIFCGLAALGILRLPDVYTRLHAASKAGVLGTGLILLGTGVASADPWILARCLLGLTFLAVTAPVSAHLLARSALKSGVEPPASMSINEFKNNK